MSEEHYTQSLTRGIGAISTLRQHRTTRSDVIFTNVGESAVAFRDVFEVDDKPVRDRDQRLQRLFTNQPNQALTQASASWTKARGTTSAHSAATSTFRRWR